MEGQEEEMMDYAGISGVGYFIPAATITSEEMSQRSGIPESVFREKIGIERKHIAGPDEHPAAMGTKAARNALTDAGITPDEIGVVVYCGLGYYDYQFWSPAAKIADSLGAKNAYAFEIRNGCNGGNLGLHVCREILIGDPRMKYALVVCSDKLSIAVNYRDPDALSSFSFGDGAVAAVLSKNDASARLLAYTSITDGSLADFVKVPYGGTQFPQVSPPLDEMDLYLRVRDPRGLDEIFSRTYLKNYLSVIQSALEKSGYSPGDIDHLFINQVKKSLTKSILAGLGLEAAKTMNTMREYGHIGPVDTLLGYAFAREKGLIRSGDLVVFGSSAIGFTWAASVLKVI